MYRGKMQNHSCGNFQIKAGAALGTTISLLVGNGLIMNILYQKVIGLNILDFWPQILRLLLTVIPPCLITILLKRVQPITSWGALILEGAVFVVIYAACICLYGLNGWERDELLKVLKRLKK